MSRMRVSDAERDQVAEVLREAAAQGRITLDELDERLDATYAAKTYADLEPLTADLPSGPGTSAGPLSPAVETRPPERRSDDVLVLRAQGSTLVRRGEWRVPHRLEVHNQYGSVRLDFREAHILDPVVELRINASWGSGDLILPETATAEVDVDTSWFAVLREDVDSIRQTTRTHFVITGTCHGGSLSIRYRRPFSWKGFLGLGG